MTEKLTEFGVGRSAAMMDSPAPADMRFDHLGDLALLCRGSQMADGVDAAAIAQAPETPRQDIGDFGGSSPSGS
jgi:hypothetical protein